ncbi:hypothetical protein [Vibrio mediterranei]|uniref:hypothetical protein n=1 Tax=Vibrio mediterranei TaxID=689 RepID=UPI0040678719
MLKLISIALTFFLVGCSAAINPEANSIEVGYQSGVLISTEEIYDVSGSSVNELNARFGEPTCIEAKDNGEVWSYQYTNLGAEESGDIQETTRFEISEEGIVLWGYKSHTGTGLF